MVEVSVKLSAWDWDVIVRLLRETAVVATEYSYLRRCSRLAETIDAQVTKARNKPDAEAKA